MTEVFVEQPLALPGSAKNFETVVTSDWRQLKLPLVRLFGRWRVRCLPAGAAYGRECRRRRSVLLLNLSDTAATSQDGLSLVLQP